jgi:tetratricopeptide (TPR) repeat protein
MEERDQILIDRYLAGELSEAELRDLHRRREEDSVFDQEVRSLEEARNALRLKERDALKERFRSRDALLDKKKPEDPVRNRNTMFILWLAAAILLMVVAWKYLFRPSASKEPVIITNEDSLDIKYPPAVIVDTIQGVDSTSATDTKKEIKPVKKPELAQSSKKGNELFAAYFEPYKDAMMDPSTRGDESLNQIQQFQKAYWDSDYQQAVKLFPGLSDSYRGNDNYRFMYANALMATGKTDQAISFLKEVIEKNTSKYKVEAKYILALALIQKGDYTSSANSLDEYIKASAAKQKESAMKLQKDLKSLIPK